MRTSARTIGILNPKGFGDRDAVVRAHIGQRVRQARLQMGMSRRALGFFAGIGSMDILKYERGIKSITPQRLFQLATALKKPVAFFFKDALADASILDRSPSVASSHLTQIRETQELIQAYSSIDNQQTRDQVIRLLREISACLRLN